VNPAPVGTGRQPGQRVVGTCRHFAVLSGAFLRSRGIAARVRCGFATYFQPGHGLDHWVTEYRDGDGRWVRIDSEIRGGTAADDPAAMASLYTHDDLRVPAGLIG
jgi:transglutaminase-like putative cysteine protease